jgi:hypothetical protein
MIIRTLVIAAALCLAVPLTAEAQFGPPPSGPAGPAKKVAPIDLTGYWVSLITEDWRYRMVTPPKGDFPGIFLTAEAQKVADAWDPAKDEAAGLQCKSYGGAAIMRVPTRLHITWKGDDTLQVDTDAGKQTRLFQFADDAMAPKGEPSWQGFSKAEWLLDMGRFRRGQPPTIEGGALKVVTTDLRPGYLRKNGVPYGKNAVVTEYFDLFKEDNGDQYLIVETTVVDPDNLRNPLITSSTFRKQKDSKGWDPEACSAQ